MTDKFIAGFVQNAATKPKCPEELDVHNLWIMLGVDNSPN